MLRVIPMLLVAIPLMAFEGLEIKAFVDHSEITIGDRFHYTIEVRYADNVELELPGVLGNLGQFEVKQFDEGKAEKLKSSGRTRKWEFELSTFTVGDYIIPPQLVEYTVQGDTAKKILYTEPVKIHVQRTSAENVKEIADIRPLTGIPSPTRIWLYLLLVFLLVGLGIGIYFLRRKKKIVKVIPRLPPYEEAMEELQRLENEELLSKGDGKLYCFRLSGILRAYLDRRFGMDTLESTTEEFISKLKSSEINEALRHEIGGFCAETDPVKFASQPLSPDQGAHCLAQVNRVLEETKPRALESAKLGDRT